MMLCEDNELVKAQLQTLPSCRSILTDRGWNLRRGGANFVAKVPSYSISSANVGNAKVLVGQSIWKQRSSSV